MTCAQVMWVSQVMPKKIWSVSTDPTNLYRALWQPWQPWPLFASPPKLQVSATASCLNQSSKHVGSELSSESTSFPSRTDMAALEVFFVLATVTHNVKLKLLSHGHVEKTQKCEVQRSWVHEKKSRSQIEGKLRQQVQLA